MVSSKPNPIEFCVDSNLLAATSVTPEASYGRDQFDASRLSKDMQEIFLDYATVELRDVKELIKRMTSFEPENRPAIGTVRQDLARAKVKLHSSFNYVSSTFSRRGQNAYF